MKEELKDLFRAIQNFRTYIGRCVKKSDYYNLMDFRYAALDMIEVFDCQYGLSKSMKKFLKHRVCSACVNTGLM